MKSPWKKFFVLLGIILADFVLIQILRAVTPQIYILRFGYMLVIAVGSLIVYYSIVRPTDWVKESIFASVVITILTIILSVVLHVFIEKNYSGRHLVVPVVAAVTPFLSGWLYRLLIGHGK